MSRKLETIRFSERSLKNFQKMDESLFGGDLVLMLLSISSIKGKTMLQKHVFLAWKTLFNKQTNDPGFFPHKFGAYSKTVDDSTQVLKNLGFIQITSGRGKIQYFITPKGRRVINTKIKKMGITLENLQKHKIDWDEWTTQGIMKFVYRNYPEYTAKTKVPHFKW